MTPEEQLHERLTLTVEIDKHGTIRWKNSEGKSHRNFGPAVIHKNGDKFWYKDGVPHREDGPAIERYNGDRIWMQEGLYHREIGPAVIFNDGYCLWYKNGILNDS